jgi:PhzF family phenazine biosynthesis protein
MVIYQVDAFTKEIFQGNPAAVCILDKEIEEELMKNIAMEMNLSETAFLLKKDKGFNLRWFTPASEVDLCGHATLASAHILWETGIIEDNKEIEFYTKSGLLFAKKEKDLIVLDFPLIEDKETDIPKEISEALNTDIIYSGISKMDYIVEIEDESLLKSMEPDFEKIKRKIKRGLIVTAKSNDINLDFISRFFAPSIGINEDPVTGSAHCCLAPYWRKKLNKTKFKAYQASKRGGYLEIEIKNNRVHIKGEAIIVLKAEFNPNCLAF